MTETPSVASLTQRGTGISAHVAMSSPRRSSSHVIVAGVRAEPGQRHDQQRRHGRVQIQPGRAGPERRVESLRLIWRARRHEAQRPRRSTPESRSPTPPLCSAPRIVVQTMQDDDHGADGRARAAPTIRFRTRLVSRAQTGICRIRPIISRSVSCRYVSDKRVCGTLFACSACSTFCLPPACPGCGTEGEIVCARCRKGADTAAASSQPGVPLGLASRGQPAGHRPARVVCRVQRAGARLPARAQVRRRAAARRAAGGDHGTALGARRHRRGRARARARSCRAQAAARLRPGRVAGARRRPACSACRSCRPCGARRRRRRSTSWDAARVPTNVGHAFARDARLRCTGPWLAGSC